MIEAQGTFMIVYIVEKMLGQLPKFKRESFDPKHRIEFGFTVYLDSSEL